MKASLARLLGAIWRKLREESALLDFFLRVDRPTGSQPAGVDGDGDGEATVLHLDVFERLMPLLELPGRAGLHAREACLVALSVKDARVGEYVATQTHLCEQLSRTLTARYLALYDTLEELQVAAAALSAPQKERQPGSGEVGGVTGVVAQRQPERAEATFAEALSLFLRHLRFCNAVGLVASDTEACLRPSRSAAHCSGVDGERSGSGTAALSAGGVDTPSQAERGGSGSGGVAPSLASQVRQLLLGEAIGPALASALESRAGFAQAIAARTIAELSAGVEGYGVAVAGIAARVGEGGRCRRQLGPLLDTVSAFLVGRDGSWGSSGALAAGRDGLSSSPVDYAGGAPVLKRSMSASMVVINSTSGASVSLRDVLLRRIESSCPSLRVSTLELIASLAELRDDRVLLDLALRPEPRLNSPPTSAAAAKSSGDKCRPPLSPPCASQAKRSNGALVDEAQVTRPPQGKGGEFAAPGGEGVQALLEASAGGALGGLRVSRAMVDSFGSAFGGSPIHPSFRRFSASHESLEGYLVEAHQRQIQQLMEAARGCHRDVDPEEEEEEEEEDKRRVLGPMAWQGARKRGENFAANGGMDLHAEAVEAAAAVGVGVVRRSAAAAEEEFDSAAFVREHGEMLASVADAEGSFVHALFDCLEVWCVCCA